MEIRKRSSKAVARRHDLNYFKKGSPLRHWQWTLTLIALGVSAVWLLGISLWRGPELLSKGPISSSHAVFGAKCEACHVPVRAGLFHRAGFQKHVPDSACQSCHAVASHQSSIALQRQAHAGKAVVPPCGTCHVEHTGSMMLAHTADANCTQCHANLSGSRFAPSIHSFVSGHPQFAALREGFVNEEGVKFSHATHLQHNLLGPSGRVDLGCADCHRTLPAAEEKTWRFGTALLEQTSIQAKPGAGGDAIHPLDARAYMTPSTYAQTCHDCHTLRFDKHIAEEAPHGSPAAVRGFIGDKLRAYAAEHPDAVAAEIRNWDSERGSERAALVPGQLVFPAPHNPAEWISMRSLQAERRLWHQSCNLCHNMQIPDDVASFAQVRHANLPGTNGAAMLPTVAPVSIKTRWLSNAVFSHQAHMAVSCESCHAQAATSHDVGDVLLPGIATCQKCHDGRSSPQGPALAAGHAESGCFLCHIYHNPQFPSGIQTSPRDLRLKETGSLQRLQ